MWKNPNTLSHTRQICCDVSHNCTTQPQPPHPNTFWEVEGRRRFFHTCTQEYSAWDIVTKAPCSFQLNNSKSVKQTNKQKISGCSLYIFTPVQDCQILLWKCGLEPTLAKDGLKRRHAKREKASQLAHPATSHQGVSQEEWGVKVPPGSEMWLDLQIGSELSEFSNLFFFFSSSEHYLRLLLCKEIITMFLSLCASCSLHSALLLFFFFNAMRSGGVGHPPRAL